MIEDEKRSGIRLDEVLMFFPVLFKNFIDHIFSYLDDDTPRIHIGVLLVLKKHGAMPISRIGEILSVAKPNMTPIIKTLIKKGWITGIPQTDRRIKTIEPTQAGLDYINGIISRLEGIVAQRFACLSPGEADEFMKSLNTLIFLGNKVITS